MFSSLYGYEGIVFDDEWIDTTYKTYKMSSFVVYFMIIEAIASDEIETGIQSIK